MAERHLTVTYSRCSLSLMPDPALASTEASVGLAHSKRIAA